MYKFLDIEDCDLALILCKCSFSEQTFEAEVADIKAKIQAKQAELEAENRRIRYAFNAKLLLVSSYPVNESLGLFGCV